MRRDRLQSNPHVQGREFDIDRIDKLRLESIKRHDADLRDPCAHLAGHRETVLAPSRDMNAAFQLGEPLQPVLSREGVALRGIAVEQVDHAGNAGPVSLFRQGV